MGETEPKTDRQLIISIVESARGDMSDQITLPSGYLDKYIEIKMEDARAEDQKTIEELQRQNKTLTELNRNLNIDNREVNRARLFAEEQTISVKNQYENYQKQVLETLTSALGEALGSLASKQVVASITEKEPEHSEDHS
jgi:hypothetical protein